VASVAVAPIYVEEVLPDSGQLFDGNVLIGEDVLAGDEVVFDEAAFQVAGGTL